MLAPLTAFCLAAAAQGYGLPPAALTAILRVEGGRVGQRVANANGTADLGPFQINTVWLDAFTRYWRRPDHAATERLLTDDGCANAWAAAAILKAHWLREGRLDRAIARYHSATPAIGARYLERVLATGPAVTASTAAK
jgi:hypothetical protein